MYTHIHTHTHTSLVKPDGSIVLRTSTYKVILSPVILKRLFYLMSIPPPHPTDKQPVINLCKTSKRPGQQTILVLTPGQSIYYKPCIIVWIPWTKKNLRTPSDKLFICGRGGGGQMDIKWNSPMEHLTWMSRSFCIQFVATGGNAKRIRCDES